MPPEDVEYLDAHFPSRWRPLSEGSGKHALLIEGFEVPDGFAQATADLMVLVPLGYPGIGLDMFYFDPPLSKLNGKDPGALVPEEHFGRIWQRWSRHYEWVVGEDDLYRHIEYVRNELERAGLQ
ncbi:MAG: hypothetical protein OXE84_03160 [Rhodobacteraceae bacterium]|nr:hypothetical protein [Paracoccaceae bacterium]